MIKDRLCYYLSRRNGQLFIESQLASERQIVINQPHFVRWINEAKLTVLSRCQKSALDYIAQGEKGKANQISLVSHP